MVFFFIPRGTNLNCLSACYPCCILSSLKALVYEQMVSDPTMPARGADAIDRQRGERKGGKKQKQKAKLLRYIISGHIYVLYASMNTNNYGHARVIRRGLCETMTTS